MIGSLGDIPFITSSNIVRKPTGLTRDHEAKFAEHAIIGQSPRTEFIGLGSKTVSFSMRLDRMLGADPLDEIQRLLAYMNEGEVLPLFIGEESLGSYTIQTLSESRRSHNAHGDLFLADISITLLEYIE